MLVLVKARVFLVFPTCIIINISFKTNSKFNHFKDVNSSGKKHNWTKLLTINNTGERESGRSRKGRYL